MSFEAFEKKVRNRFTFNLFLLYKLPAAFISGVRLQSLQPASASTTVPYTWLSQNPFNSTYFACQAMAAELSTGILALAHVYQLKPSVSTLVQHIEGSFFKKATGKLTFKCEDGLLIKHAIDQAMQTGEAVTVRCCSKGFLADGIIASEFFITWSFKTRTARH